MRTFLEYSNLYVSMRCELITAKVLYIHDFCNYVIQVLNLYANDGERLFQGGTWAAQVANGPVVIIVGMSYAISLFGLWALIGFAILLLMIPLQVRTLKAIGDN